MKMSVGKKIGLCSTSHSTEKKGIRKTVPVQGTNLMHATNLTEKIMRKKKRSCDFEIP